jgi:ribosome recycling factor
MDILKDTENKMVSAIEHLKVELRAIRTGRANPAMLDKVFVDVYGSKMPLKDLGTVNSPEPRQLVISPYDRSNLNAIVKGIEVANLNVRAIVDGHVVRVMVPEMDESVRKEMVKIAKKKAEESKVAIRNVRRDGNELLKKQKADGIVSEDQLKKGEKKIQELTDKYCKQVDEITSQKEKEILTI